MPEMWTISGMVYVRISDPGGEMTSLELAIGRKVRTKTAFSGIPMDTLGEIVQASNSWPETKSVAIQWERFPGDTLRDWFAFDELQYLEVVGAPTTDDREHQMLAPGVPLHTTETGGKECIFCGINVITGRKGELTK